MKPLWQLLVSRKFAVWLLVVLVLFSLAGIAFPDAGITTSVLSLALCAVLFLSILACTVRRAARRDDWESEPAKAVVTGADLYVHESGKACDVIGSDVAGLLREKGWRVDDRRAGELMAFQGEVGFWGSILFHVGMLVIIVGAMLSTMSRSSAGFIVNEGETKDLMAPGALAAEPSLMGAAKVPLKLTLRKFDADYVGGGHPVDYRAILWLEEAGRQPREYNAGVNRQFRVGDADIFLDKYGFAPRFILAKDDGTVLSDYHYTMVVKDGKEDTTQLPEIGATVTVQFFPSFQLQEGNRVANVSQEPTNPGMVISVAREGRVVVSRAFVPMGKRVRFDGMSLQFAGWKYWAHFGISRDLGVSWILAGFLAMVLGLLLRVAYPERRVWVRIEEGAGGSRVAVGGHGGHFPAMFRKELESLNEKIRAAL